MSTITKIAYMALITCALFLAGCAGMEKFGMTLQDAGNVGESIGQAVGDISPLYGTIITAVSALLTASGAYMAKVSSKRLKASKAIIEGISQAEGQNGEVKKLIRLASKKEGVEKYVNKLVRKFDRA